MFLGLYRIWVLSFAWYRIAGCHNPLGPSVNGPRAQNFVSPKAGLRSARFHPPRV